MISKEEKIKAIYDKIANKELSFGCKFEIGIFELEICKLGSGGGEIHWCQGGGLTGAMRQNFIDNAEIIGHPVMIGDVLDYLKLKRNVKGDKMINSHSKCGADIYGLLKYWEILRKPIEKQSEECIDYVYNLIK